MMNTTGIYGTDIMQMNRRLSIFLNIIIYMFLFASCAESGMGLNTSEKKIVDLLLVSRSFKDYDSLLADYKNLYLKKVKDVGPFDVYQIQFLNDNHGEKLFFFIENEKESVYRLTNSEDNFNKYLLPYYEEKVTENLFLDFLEFTRNQSKLNLFLYDINSAQKLLKDEVFNMGLEFLFKLDCLGSGNIMTCKVPVLKDQNLYIRELKLSKEGISYVDTLEIENASKFISL